MDARWFAAGAAALVLAGASCKPADACAEDGAACGGDPAGAWNMTASCQDPTLPDPAIATRSYRGQPLVSAGEPPPEPTSSDWCADLVYGPNGIDFLNLPRNAPRLFGGYLVFQDDDATATSGSYSAILTTRDVTSIEFSSTCLDRFGFTAAPGAPPDCAAFATSFATFGTTLGGVKDTACAPSGSGCLCTYTIEADAAGSNLSGVWRRLPGEDGALTLYASNHLLPSKTDYCRQGDTMTLWGHDRTSIMDFSGTRTLHLARVVCGDGKVDRGEQCDPPDGVTCNDACQTVAN